MSMKRMWAISSFTSEEDADDIRFLSIRELEIDRGYFSRPLSIEGSQSQTRAPRARYGEPAPQRVPPRSKPFRSVYSKNGPSDFDRICLGKFFTTRLRSVFVESVDCLNLLR